MRYAPHETLVEPARRSPEIWRIFIGLGVVVLVYIVGMMMISPFFTGFGDPLADPATRVVPPPGSALLLLFSFGFIIAGLAGALHWFHRRSLVSLVGPLGSGLQSGWRIVRMLVILQAALFLLPPFGFGVEVAPNIELGTWLLLLPLTLAGVLVQVTAEELLFRGYLQQQLAARFASPLLWLVVPSAVFALGHYAPSEYGVNAPFVVIWAFAFGIAAADLTARTGSLTPAIALHFVNNVIGIALISATGTLSSLALYSTDALSATENLPPSAWLAELFALLVAWLAVRIAVRA